MHVDHGRSWQSLDSVLAPGSTTDLEPSSEFEGWVDGSQSLRSPELEDRIETSIRMRSNGFEPQENPSNGKLALAWNFRAQPKTPKLPYAEDL